MENKIELTVSQCAEFLQTNRQTIQNMIKDGRLNGRYIGQRFKNEFGINPTERLPLVIEEDIKVLRSLIKT